MDPIIKSLLSQKEGTSLERKEYLSRQVIEELPKDIAAMSNSEGGYIIAGQTNSLKVTGVSVNQEELTTINIAASRCKPPIVIKISEVEVPPTILLIQIPKSNWIHADDRNRFPQRLGDTTVFMDASSLISLAKERALLASPALSIPPSLSRKKPGPDEDFIVSQLSMLDPIVKLEALSDLNSVTWRVSLENSKSLRTLLHETLKDSRSDLRLKSIELLQGLTWRLGPRAKPGFQAEFRNDISKLVFDESDQHVRAAAVVLICIFGERLDAETMMRIILNEPRETYQQLRVEGNLLRLVESGNGHFLRRRLHEELAKSTDAYAREKIISNLHALREMHWPD